LLKKELLWAAKLNPVPLAKYSASAWATVALTPVFFSVMFWSVKLAPVR